MKKNGQKEREKNLNKLSEWILDYDKNAYCSPKIRKENRQVLIDSFNECSDLRKSFHDSLQNFFNNLGFSASMRNIHKFDNSFTSSDNIFSEKRKTFGYPGDFGLIKNNSISKFETKKTKKGNHNQNQNKAHLKPITSIRKKMLPFEKFYDENEEVEEDDEIKKKKKEKAEKDKSELDIINKMVYGDIGKEAKYGHEKVDILTEEVIESENEDSEKRSKEINKILGKNKNYEKNKDKDKLLNNIFDEFEKRKNKKFIKEINNEEEQERDEKYNLNLKNYKTERKLNQENEKLKSTKETNTDRNYVGRYDDYGYIYNKINGRKIKEEREYNKNKNKEEYFKEEKIINNQNNFSEKINSKNKYNKYKFNKLINKKIENSENEYENNK